jgi:hypothetical protein
VTRAIDPFSGKPVIAERSWSDVVKSLTSMRSRA